MKVATAAKAPAVIAVDMLPAGIIVGAPAWGAVSDTYGRRTAFLVSTFMTVAVSFAAAAASSYGMLLACRLLAGIGVSGAVTSVRIDGVALRPHCMLLLSLHNRLRAYTVLLDSVSCG
jgi:MFS family permease